MDLGVNLDRLVCFRLCAISEAGDCTESHRTDKTWSDRSEHGLLPGSLMQLMSTQEPQNNANFTFVLFLSYRPFSFGNQHKMKPQKQKKSFNRKRRQELPRGISKSAVLH